MLHRAYAGYVGPQRQLQLIRPLKLLGRRLRRWQSNAVADATAAAAAAAAFGVLMLDGKRRRRE